MRHFDVVPEVRASRIFGFCRGYTLHCQVYRVLRDARGPEVSHGQASKRFRLGARRPRRAGLAKIRALRRRGLRVRPLAALDGRRRAAGAPRASGTGPGASRPPAKARQRGARCRRAIVAARLPAASCRQSRRGPRLQASHRRAIADVRAPEPEVGRQPLRPGHGCPLLPNLPRPDDDDARVRPRDVRAVHGEPRRFPGPDRDAVAAPRRHPVPAAVPRSDRAGPRMKRHIPSHPSPHRS